jgi:histidinol-phosphate aminotransferase
MVGMAVVSRGDGVMVAPPTFGLFDLIARIFEGRVLSVDQIPGFQVDATRLLETAPKAKLTFLCSPNNPTGQSISLDLLETILDRSPGLVLWDEAYAEFNGVSARPLLERHPNLMVLRTFSKAFGLAGLRIGYLMGHAALMAQLSKVNIPYNVNLFSALAALRMLEHPGWMEARVREIVQERDRLTETLAAIPGIEPFPSQANFVLIRMPDGKAVFESLLAKGVLLRSVNGHTLLARCLRVTVGTPQENRIFVDALKETIQESNP